ncbi:circularly permuted type 2 ATP-grasp protein [Marinomonas ostreistagni]|uniref:Circularly permuted type 2 ATP-grasp protein n=1 Tax=Marinomonas ostreistagni TaxID=359209 RepID=A0ABS0Z7W1_9GAMM|nr:circularly permuted type 2 ATP-grasp protein [Marinomonas ostreistagni]MBJ7549749.1 circularly permuted type 2 ATP-grasp protein [Marinomonas ostreistagni]
MTNIVTPSTAALTEAPFVAPYAAPENAFDEAFEVNRLPRLAWQSVMSAVHELGAEGMQDRHLRAQRILRDDGATYNLKSDPLSPNVWSLDIIPQVMVESEWRVLEAALKQRAKLFDLIYKDLYGEQRLLKEGILPSEIVFSHPGFLRQCHGLNWPTDIMLTFHAVDLVRDQSGRFIATGDRTQAPSGAGYALENRTVVSRVLPSLFRESQTMRLAGFFQTVRETLSKLALHLTESPRIVVLTPGAYSSTYFEQAYMANHLGYPLVQGGDLTVRNGKVWMKSLNGLSRVDVIVRRVEDAFCDQAELRSDSMLGVPGLLEVARQGNVVVTNPLGSGLLETPAILAFLPQISQFLMAEELLLDSVETYWCGDTNHMGYIEANLKRLIIKPAFRGINSKSIYCHQLDAKGLADTLAMVKANPVGFVAQHYIPSSYSPIWDNGVMHARPGILRTFSVATDEDFCVMPGGLSRVADHDDQCIVSKRLSGSRSKDMWVLSDSTETDIDVPLDNLPTSQAQAANLPSRVVENLFWFGRYAERAEMSLRLMRTIFKQLNGIDRFPTESREVLLGAMSEITGSLPGFQDQPELIENPNDELAALVVDANRVGSIKANLQQMLACAEQVKEMLSADTRIILNELRDHIHSVDRAYVNGLPSVPEESLDSLVTSLLAISGLNHESMLRGMDWMFQEIGRRTERALLTANLLKQTLSRPLPSLQQQQVLESVLLSVEALISFRRRYRTRARVSYGLDLLMIDRSNPRSLIYQIEQLRKYLEELPQSEQTVLGLSPDKRLIIKSLNDIQLADLESLAQIDESTQTRADLAELMTQIIEQLEKLTTLISDKYFDHTAGPQQLIKAKWKNNV